MLLNDNILDIEKYDRICSLTLVVNEFLELFIHPSIFMLNIQHSFLLFFQDFFLFLLDLMTVIA